MEAGSGRIVYICCINKKESGSPDSRAGARLHQHPYFLGVKCASPGGFYRIGDGVSYTIKKVCTLKAGHRPFADPILSGAVFVSDQGDLFAQVLAEPALQVLDLAAGVPG